MQEIPDSAAVDKSGDPDYVVLEDEASSSGDEFDKEEELKGKKLARMEKKIREEKAR